MMSASLRSGVFVRAAKLTQPGLTASILDNTRLFSSKGKGSNKFRPRRRPNKAYRPTKPFTKHVHDPSPGNDRKFVDIGNVKDPKDELEATVGPIVAESIKGVLRDRKRLLENPDSYGSEADETLRMMDYFVARPNTTEDVVGMRKALARDYDTQEERDEFIEQMEEEFAEQRLVDMGIDPASQEKLNQGKVITPLTKFETGPSNELDSDPDTYMDPNQKAFGVWSEMLVGVDRSVKLWRGGRLESYRALVIGGNLNGCGGFGMGKSKDPMDAVTKASRICKRNIFFCDRFQGDGLTRDLVGKQNNCKVIIRSTDNGLRGNELVREILKRFGITNAVSKAHGRRNPYNVVQATFKALLTHESLEEIALKRGRRLISLERAARMKI